MLRTITYCNNRRVVPIARRTILNPNGSHRDCNSYLRVLSSYSALLSKAAAEAAAVILYDSEMPLTAASHHRQRSNHQRSINVLSRRSINTYTGRNLKLTTAALLAILGASFTNPLSRVGTTAFSSNMSTTTKSSSTPLSSTVSPSDANDDKSQHPLANIKSNLSQSWIKNLSPEIPANRLKSKKIHPWRRRSLQQRATPCLQRSLRTGTSQTPHRSQTHPLLPQRSERSRPRGRRHLLPRIREVFLRRRRRPRRHRQRDPHLGHALRPLHHGNEIHLQLPFRNRRRIRWRTRHLHRRGHTPHHHHHYHHTPTLRTPTERSRTHTLLPRRRRTRRPTLLPPRIPRLQSHAHPRDIHHPRTIPRRFRWRGHEHAAVVLRRIEEARSAIGGRSEAGAVRWVGGKEEGDCAD